MKIHFKSNQNVNKSIRMLQETLVSMPEVAYVQSPENSQEIFSNSTVSNESPFSVSADSIVLMDYVPLPTLREDAEISRETDL